jgi:hypothetical protein
VYVWPCILAEFDLEQLIASAFSAIEFKVSTSKEQFAIIRENIEMFSQLTDSNAVMWHRLFSHFAPL